MTARAPFAAATDMAVVMPRSLKDPVGLRPSYFTCTWAPTSSLRCSAGTRGVPPSRRVTVGAPASIGSRSAYSVMMPRHWCAMSVPLHTHDGGDRVDRLQPGELVDRRGERGVGRRVGDDDQLGSGRPLIVRDHLLADRLDRDPVVGEDRCDGGEDPGAVGDVEADVIAGDRLSQ